MKPASRKIGDLLNLGRQSSQYLKAIGITDEADLRQTGVIETYLMLKAAFPSETNTVFLWALEGALTNTHWQQIPPERKQQLLDQILYYPQTFRTP